MAGKYKAAKPDVRVRVRRGVVQVQSKDPCISTIVPVTTPDEPTRQNLY